MLLTRPVDDEDRVAELLAAAGATVLRAPMIRFEAVGDDGALRAALADDRVAILTSVRAVDAVRGLLPSEKRVVTLAARTRERAAGLHVLPTRDARDGEDLALAIREHFGDVGNTRFVMVRSDVAEPSVVKALRAMGADVVDVVGYRTVPVDSVGDDVTEALAAGRVDAIVCMSPSQVRTLVGLVGVKSVEKCVRVAPGKTTAQAWLDEGLPVHAVAAKPDADAIVEALGRVWH